MSVALATKKGKAYGLYALLPPAAENRPAARLYRRGTGRAAAGVCPPPAPLRQGRNAADGGVLHPGGRFDFAGRHHRRKAPAGRHLGGHCTAGSRRHFCRCAGGRAEPKPRQCAGCRGDHRAVPACCCRFAARHCPAILAGAAAAELAFHGDTQIFCAG